MRFIAAIPLLGYRLVKMKIKLSSSPIFFQSKLLCFSVFYLLISITLAIYTTFYSTKCLFRSSPFDPIQSPLFYYNSSYGEHKYALPTYRTSCDSPVFFKDYGSVLDEMQRLIGNSKELGSHNLKYIKGYADTFGGNFSIEKRFSYFDHGDEGTEIPCGFFKHFPVSNSDRIVMERCNGMVVVSVIFNEHDKIRQPKGLGSRTLDYVCFFMFVDDVTLKGLDYHNLISRKSKEYGIGVWRIVKVSNEHLYDNAAMNGIIPKYLVHRLFPNTKYSIWIDAKLQLVVDPLLLLHSLVIKEGNVDMAVSRHPIFLHTLEEATATARWKKWWDIEGLKTQMETYCGNGMEPWSPEKPYPSDVPDSALIIRKHSVASNLFSCLLFNELDGFNPRDQLPFAFIRDKMNPKMKMNMFHVEVFEQVALEYRHNLKHSSSGPSGGVRVKRAGSDLFVNGSSSKCDKYLLTIWGESHD
ncbi:hypothetical protein LIER_20548 [Lithospermum erythrorhizon]|uniref:TOD1/MUCI70 glycosyltransferase-like domain-containing protein n=1 Tax=Lithospermum erythrorhizon TaxID=34254 RepID=A0AAV3QQZ3_LITER